jgi:environmental stress-induced protein Ves
MQARLLSEAVPQPWRNGGGVTRELLAWPDAADWQLRLSVATIGKNGPFSAFPGVQRWFVVLEGDGVQLQFDGDACTLRPGDAALHFDGALAPGCTLLGGETQDLNLMLRGTGALQPALPGQPWNPSAAWRGVFCTGAATLHAGEASHALPAAGALFGREPGPWQLQTLAAGARAWWFHIEAAR